MEFKPELCEECGVPLMISREFKWESNGIIGMRLSPAGRAVFYESEVMDGLFRGIEELLGRSIWHIVTESRRRDVRKYMEKIFSSQKSAWKQSRKYQRSQSVLDMRKADMIQVNGVGRIYGYGGIELSDRWGREDYPWRTQTIKDPYSMYLYPAELLGSVEALEQIDMWVKYREIGEKVYEVTTFPSSHPVGLGKRLQQKRYPYKAGEIEYETCPGCGLPQEIAACTWDLEAGTITDNSTGRRMAIFGPWAIDAVLNDIEEELGEPLQEAVVESLRLFIKETMRQEAWRKAAGDFPRKAALRGLGNLVRFNAGRDHLTLTIQNSCMPLLMVGAVQALVELAYDAESSVYEWNLADDGDLTITIRLPVEGSPADEPPPA
jgi:hypothetical protein